MRSITQKAREEESSSLENIFTAWSHVQYEDVKTFFSAVDSGTLLSNMQKEWKESFLENLEQDADVALAVKDRIYLSDDDYHTLT